MPCILFLLFHTVTSITAGRVMSFAGHCREGYKGVGTDSVHTGVGVTILLLATPPLFYTPVLLIATEVTENTEAIGFHLTLWTLCALWLYSMCIAALVTLSNATPAHPCARGVLPPWMAGMPETQERFPVVHPEHKPLSGIHALRDIRPPWQRRSCASMRPRRTVHPEHKKSRSICCG